jgi:hypothetical protein
MSTTRHGFAAVSFYNKIYVMWRGPQPDGFGTSINKVLYVGNARS